MNLIVAAPPLSPTKKDREESPAILQSSSSPTIGRAASGPVTPVQPYKDQAGKGAVSARALQPVLVSRSGFSLRHEAALISAKQKYGFPIHNN